MVEPWKSLTWRARLKLLALALLPVVVLSIGAEVLARLAIHREFEVVQSESTGRSEYVFRIGRFPWSRVARTPLNSLRFPDEEFDTVRKSPDCTHILFVGDSYVFGDGVDADKAFVSLVRDRLSQRLPARCVRVFNIGERASSIEQQLHNVRKVWPLLEPDLVLLAHYQNDLTDLTKTWFAQASGRDTAVLGTTWRPRVSFAPLQLSLVRWLSYHMVAIASRNHIRYDLLSRWSILADSTNLDVAAKILPLYTTVFDSLVTEVRGHGAALGTIVLPSKFDIPAGRSPEEAFFTGLATARGVPTLPLFAAFDAARNPYPFLLYDGHLNEIGNLLVAREIEAWVFSDTAPPFPSLITPPASRSDSGPDASPKMRKP